MLKEIILLRAIKVKLQMMYLKDNEMN